LRWLWGLSLLGLVGLMFFLTLQSQQTEPVPLQPTPQLARFLATEDLDDLLDALDDLGPLSGDDEQSAFVRRLSTLTPQQIRVLMMLSDGLMNKQIAYELSISEATVKAHVSAILQKLDVDSRTQAVIAAARIEEGQFEALLGREG